MKYPSAGKGRGGIREKNSMGRNYVVSVFQIKRRKKQRAKQAATINVGCLEIPWFCYSFSNVSTLYVTFSFLYRGARTDSQYYIDMRCRIYNSPHLKNKLPFILLCFISLTLVVPTLDFLFVRLLERFLINLYNFYFATATAATAAAASGGSIYFHERFSPQNPTNITWLSCIPVFGLCSASIKICIISMQGTEAIQINNRCWISPQKKNINKKISQRIINENYLGLTMHINVSFGYSCSFHLCPTIIINFSPFFSTFIAVSLR